MESYNYDLSEGMTPKTYNPPLRRNRRRRYEVRKKNEVDVEESIIVTSDRVFQADKESPKLEPTVLPRTVADIPKSRDKLVDRGRGTHTRSDKDISSDDDSNLFDRPVTESATAWDSRDSQGPSNTEYWNNIGRQAKQAMREMTGNDVNLSGSKYPDVVKEIARVTIRAWAENNARPVEQRSVCEVPGCQCNGRVEYMDWGSEDMTETDHSEYEDPIDRANRLYVESCNYDLSEGMTPMTYTPPLRKNRPWRYEVRKKNETDIEESNRGTIDDGFLTDDESPNSEQMIQPRTVADYVTRTVRDRKDNRGCRSRAGSENDSISDENSNLFDRPVTESATAWAGIEKDSLSEEHVKCCEQPVTESITVRVPDTEEPLVMRVSTITMDQEIISAKEERKMHKTNFTLACRHNTQNKNLMKTIYIDSQKTVRNLIQNHQKQTLRKTADKIIKEGGSKSNNFWRTRKRIMNHNKNDDYETIDENENEKKIENPSQAKTHIANYFETLYQAREGEPNYEEWTKHIKNTVDTIAKNNTKSQDENPFSTQELNKCIKTLKRRKSTGPDNIPNEALIEADPITRAIYLETLNKVYTEEIIPQEWQHGEIKRICKGKGTKGKCSNERGITLASNMGKLFERLMNNKIKKETLITPAQAGGQEGMATVDHLMILNSLINQSKKTKKKELYIAFLDVTKAYDKAWLDAIMYSMHKSGLKGKNWRIAREINSNLTATIKTKFGPTRMIKIKDSIRQGGVLSVIEYANLIDEIAKELQEMEVGNQNLWNTPTPGCLLWMDDVALIHNDKEELNKMLSITNDIANRYHIKFGKDKSQILTINNKNPTSDTLIGNQILDPTETYKYLGMTMNSKGNLEDHIKKTKGKTEAALQTILSLAGNDEFHNIEMDIIWKLVHSCIIPIITYGAEI